MCPQSDDPTVPPSDVSGSQTSQERSRIPFADGVLDRYLLGLLDPEETIRVQEYFDAPVRRQQLAQLRAWIDGASDPAPPDRILAHAELWSRIESEHRSAKGHEAGRDVLAGSGSGAGRRKVNGFGKSPLLVRKYSLAVGTAVLVGLFVLAGFPLRRAIQGSFTGALSSDAIPVGREYATKIGQRATVILTDGTRVRLAPQTVLRVAQGFDGDARNVTVDGEAYFDVDGRANSPFVVHTGRVTTRVLGTSFDVRHYPGDPDVRVAVVVGKVAVHASLGHRLPSILTAGSTAAITDSSTTIIDYDSVSATSWVDGQLVFHGAPTLTVLAELTRWYGYQFRLTDSTLAGERLTLELSTESSQTALATLRNVLNVDLAFEHGVVIMSPRRNGRTPVRHRGELTPFKAEVGR